MTIILNVKLDKSVIESLFLNKQYAVSGFARMQFVVDKRIYPSEPFDAPIFTFSDCSPDQKMAYILKISVGPRLAVSRVSTTTGGLKKMQIVLSIYKPKPNFGLSILYLAKTGLPLTTEQIAGYREYRWGYPCRLLSHPDKIVAYFYIAPTS